MGIVTGRGALRRTTTRAGAVIAIAALTIGITACSGRGQSGEQADAGEGRAIEKFSIVAPENESDHGWNQAGLIGAQLASEATGVELEELADSGWDNSDTIFSQVASSGSQFIIAHASGFAQAAQTTADREDVAVLVVDHGEQVPGKVSVLTTAAEQGAYLAGIAAAMTTTSRKIGIVVSADDLNWFNMSSGFAEGVYSVDPGIEVVYAQLGPAEYADSAGGKSTTEQLIAAGADVIFGMGDGATVGYLQAVETAATDVKYIATIGDVTGVVNDPSTVLTSVLWNFEGAYTSAIEDLEAGTYGEEGYELNLENGGISLQESDGLTPEIQAAVDEATEKIIAGDIVPTAADSADEVKAVIKAK